MQKKIKLNNTLYFYLNIPTYQLTFIKLNVSYEMSDLTTRKESNNVLVK